MKKGTAATQPPASGLLDYEALIARVAQLAEGPRVSVGYAGFSHEGREIPYMVVAAPDAIERLEYHKRMMRNLLVPRLHHRTLLDVEVVRAAIAVQPQRVPVLLVGASFGNEAAHVEALLELAETLATSDEPLVQEILDRIIVILIPLMNPDGREAALTEWRQRPNSAALRGSVNAWGQILNRDFLWLTQPETRAVMRVYREWHPVAAYDPHEDMYMLGVTRPFTCWTPPFARPVHPELHPTVVEAINEMGHAIADAWRERGFNMLYEPHGNHDFMTLFRLGGRFHLSMALHGTPALITESARTPGTQTWDERIQQKVSAGLAVLRRVTRDPNFFIEAVRASREWHSSLDAFVLPYEGNPPEALRFLVETLLMHEVLVYEAEDPYPAYVVPTSQPEARLVRSLLESAGWNLVALLPALGIRSVRVAEMPDSGRDAFLGSPLVPVRRVARRAEKVSVSVSRDDAQVVVLNTPEGIAALNALWKSGTKVWWLTRESEAGLAISRGAFLVSIPRTVLLSADLRWGREVLKLNRTARPDKALEVSCPRIALYVGQGVDDRYLPMTGDIRWALQEMGFGWIELREDDFDLDVLQTCNVLIIPGGDPNEIVNGRTGQHPWQRPPWDIAGRSKGIGRTALDALRRFVEGGGNYVGIGLGGGVLAGPEYAGLLEIVLAEHSLGEARVNLKVEHPDHLLLLAINTTLDRTGGSTFPAYYYSEPSAGILGGPIFAAQHKADVVATFAAPVDDAASQQFIKPDPLKDALGAPAILHARLGRGRVTVFSISPGFRCGWRSTYTLLSNAVLVGVAGGNES